MPQSYTQLFYHVAWATRGRQPTLTPPVLGLVLTAIQEKSGVIGAAVHAANGVEDHIHLVVRLPATMPVSTFVEQVKGYAAWRVNHSPEVADGLEWQAGYGALTFRKSELSTVIRYVQRQKEHHAAGEAWAEFERVSED